MVEKKIMLIICFKPQLKQGECNTILLWKFAYFSLTWGNSYLKFLNLPIKENLSYKAQKLDKVALSKT